MVRPLSHNEVIAGSIPAIGTIPPWCSGSTTDFGSVSLGSSPGGGATLWRALLGACWRSLPLSVIGSTTDSGSVILGSSPGGAAM